MPRLLTCLCGNQWEDDGADAPVCPVCGTVSAPSTAKSDTATVLHANWKSIGPVEQAPPVLPDFEILEEIGRGGMGIVYRARRREDGAILAIKVIRKDRLQHEEAVRRFRREAQAASRLSHPNIVTVYDSDHSGDTHYLVMEYVPGVTLERQVDENGPLPIPLACDFIRQAALGLQHAHEQALVHRDIKPSNLMVTPAPTGNAANCVVKLLDMGVARVLQIGGSAPGDSLSTLTQGGSVIGTADYIAPEQLEDAHGADIRADLYSLGCTFYFLLTGQVPFPASSLIAKLDAQRWQTATPLEQLRGEASPGLARVVDRLMAKNPADRFQTPGEVADELTLLAQHGHDDPPPPRIEFRELRRLAEHADAVLCTRFAPDGQHFASGGKDGLVFLWDRASGEIVQRYPRHPQEVRDIAFSPTADLLATCSGFTVRLYNRAGQELKRFGGHSGAIRCLAFSPDGKRLATGSDDKTIRLWDMPSGREVLRLSRHTGAVTAIAFTPDNRLASASWDQTARLWDLRSGLEVEGFGAHAGNVLDIAVSPDGTRLASAHFDTIIRIWDIASASEIGQCVGHKQMVSGIAFTADGARLVSVGQDHTLRLWDIETFSELTCTACHSAGINALAVSDDGAFVVTAGADKMLVLSALP